MAHPKDDASTDVEVLSKRSAEDMTSDDRARLSRQKNMGKSDQFEKNCAGDPKAHLEKYTRKEKK